MTTGKGTSAGSESVMLSPLVKAALAMHAAVPLAVAVQPAIWPWGIGALAGVNAFCAAAGMHPRNQLLGPNLSRCATPGAVALTFDDGPDPEVTPRVLDLLDEHQARATFFLIGERVRAAPELTSEIAERGHRVENHSFRHPLHFGFLGPRALAREVDATQRAISETTGRTPRLFRAPAGVRSPFLQPILARRGLLLCSWTRRGYDAVSTDPRRVLERLCHGLRAGDTLLLHDGRAHSRSGRGNPAVLDVLPALFETLRRADLSCVPLEEPSP